MDGHFVPNLTFGAKTVADLRRATALPLDVHLMIDRPEEWVDEYVAAGATYLTVHVEASRDVATAIRSIRARGARPGITLSPGTGVDAVLPHLGAVDLALVMSVQPGFAGQAFIDSALEKIRRLRAELDAQRLTHVELEVDGGIKPENARQVADAGASVLVAGSAVYLDPGGPAVALRKFRRALDIG
jgi:ribulose-phosphate 3-epimerase